jgi:RING-type zinc-finger
MDSALQAVASERIQLLTDIDGIDYGATNTSTSQTAAHSDVENPAPPIELVDRENDRDTMIERLTGRLRCLFSAITWPIVPLGTLVSLCLIWVMYSAFVMDIKSSCSHPLHAYALASMCFLVYAPYHARIRTFLFRYSRERDGPIRPTRVRLYDQLFHTLCILYVYGGVTLMQSCKQDFGDKRDNGNALAGQNSTNGFANTCDATCTHLYSALDVYVTMLELFTLSLILPLLFLPCIYLWILRSASTEAEAFWHESLEDSDDLFGRRPRITAQELMDSLEHVQLVRHGDTLVLRGSTDSDPPTHLVKECCICMSDFKIQEQEEDTTDTVPLLDDDGDAIVRTKCGHVFHATCLGGWVGGRWDPQERRRRTRRTCCPLCRDDLQPTSVGRTTGRTRIDSVPSTESV